MSQFVVGDVVRCKESYDSFLLAGKEYIVADEGNYQSQSIAVEGVPYFWLESRFELVRPFTSQKNPTTELKLTREYVEELEATIKGFQDAIRPMLPEKLDHSPCPADAEKAAKAYVRMDRALFLGQSYNWYRKGLKWEFVARDLFNYILTGFGREPLAKDTALLPEEKP